MPRCPHEPDYRRIRPANHLDNPYDNNGKIRMITECVYCGIRMINRREECNNAAD